MNYQKVIEFKIQTLVDLMLTNGVSPSELSENIFEKQYISISFSKVGKCIIGKLDFYDSENHMQNIQMIYTYTTNKQLIRIEEEKNGEKCLLWDRKKREEELLEELLYFMNFCYDSNEIENFIMSLPPNLRTKVKDYILALSA